MTEQQILKEAARLRGKRSWAARVKKAGGKRAAAKTMKAIRASKPPEKLSTG
jgi:hypothetical protein